MTFNPADPGPLLKSAVGALRYRGADVVASPAVDLATQRLVLAAVEACQISLTIADVTRPEQPLVYVNEAFERTTGFARADAIGRNCRFLQGPGTDPAGVAALRMAIEASSTVEVELLNYRRSGEPFWNRIFLSPLHDEDGRLRGYVGIQHDVTEQHERAAADERRRTLTALGRVAGHVAREIDDLLQPLSSLPDRVEGALSPDAAAARTDLQTIRAVALDARGILRRILDFGRNESPLSEPEPLEPALADALAAAARTLPPGVRLERQLAAGAVEVALSGPDMRQIVGNLLANAADAMAGEGTVTVTAKVRRLPGRAPEAVIEVRDEGPGIAPEHRRQVFDPFYSTKPVNVGSGLGLFIVDEIVRRAGGAIAAKAAPGGGTTFEIRLPATTPGKAGKALPDRECPDPRH